MMVVLLLTFLGLFGLVWRDLRNNQGSVADWWASLIPLSLALAWFILIVIAVEPPRPLEALHDTLMKVPALRPFIGM